MVKGIRKNLLGIIAKLYLNNVLLMVYSKKPIFLYKTKVLSKK